jgi:hypothetical protein
MHIPEIMGGGAALFDCDGDRDLDVYLVNGAFGITREDTQESVRLFTPDPGGPLNRLFRREADGTYTDVTDGSGLGDAGYGMGVAVGDVDNDGDLDVYVTNVGLDRLYRNDGSGRFEDVTEAAGIRVDNWSTSAAFVDYDRDGFLDLYVCRYLDYDPKATCTDYAGRVDFCGPKSYPPISDVLLHNNGNGTFTDVSARAGMAAVAAHGLGVVCEDFNDDGWQDIYVANDGDANQLWMNKHDGTFVDEAMFLGCALNWHGLAEAGMGVISNDLDDDLKPDVFITHLAQESNVFFRNLGAAGFQDATAAANLERSSIPFTGFGTVAFDADLDGDQEILVANGRVLRQEAHPQSEMTSFWRDYAEPNLFYVNEGSGRFTLANELAPAFCNRIEIARALAAGDLDEDGDLDFLVSRIQGPARLYRNDAPRKGHWTLLRATDPALRRDAIGARVIVSAGGRKWMRTVQAGYSYLTSNDPRVHVGLGAATTIDEILVRWPDGAQERFVNVSIDRAIDLVRGQGAIVS